MTEENYKAIPNQFNSSCFACSPDNPVGLKMNFEAGEDSVISQVVVPEHLCGWSNLVHGGVISTILDEIMSWSALHFLRSLVLTKSMNVSFLKPLNVGEKLKAVGQVLNQTGKHEALMEGKLYNPKGELCARAEGVFATFPPEVGNRFGIAMEDLPDWIKE